MKELVGRISALDPKASKTLKVIAYFDKLVDGRVGAEGMLRGAAMLCGAPIGHRPVGQARGRRFSADGTELDQGTPDNWPTVVSDSSVVWLERPGAAHANDAMVLERLAIALSILSMRLDTSAPTRRAVEVLLAHDATEEDRDEASASLGLGAHATIHAVAIPASVTLDRRLPHAMIATRFGIVRAALAPKEEAPAAWAGIGIAAHTSAELRESWRSALIALRLADADLPIVRASDLGALRYVAETEDQHGAMHPDVDAVDELIAGSWSERLLQSVADGASQRTLAAEAGVHHSTMGARLHQLPGHLGYDPLSPAGRRRLAVALMLHRLATVRFDDPR